MAIRLIVVVEMETDTESVADGILDAMSERLSDLGWLERKSPIRKRHEHLKGSVCHICEADDDAIVAQKASCRLATGWATMPRHSTFEQSVMIWDARDPGESFHPAIRFISVEASARWVFADPSRPSNPSPSVAKPTDD